jgi:hypothetical protein
MEADFDVAVHVGLSSRTEKEAVQRQLLAMKQYVTDPETNRVMDALLMMNMDGEGIEETRDFWRKQLVAMGAVQPTEEEAAQLAAANDTPDPNTVYLNAKAVEAQANAQNKQADTGKKLAEMERTEAETQEIYADLGRKDVKTVMELANG